MPLVALRCEIASLWNSFVARYIRREIPSAGLLRAGYVRRDSFVNSFQTMTHVRVNFQSSELSLINQ